MRWIATLWLTQNNALKTIGTYFVRVSGFILEPPILLVCHRSAKMQISLKVAEVLPIYARREIMIDRRIFQKLKLHSNCIIEVSCVTRFSAYTGRVLIQKCLFAEVEKCVIILIRQSHLRNKLNPRVKMK